MIETTPVSVERNFPASNEQILSRIIQNTGYTQYLPDSKAHPRSELHFSRSIIESPYPRFHVIYNGTNRRINLHLDNRPHRSNNRSSQVSQEIAVLLKGFAKESLSITDAKSLLFLQEITRQLKNIALFGSNSNRTDQKLGNDTPDYSKKTSITSNKKARLQARLELREFIGETSFI